MIRRLIERFRVGSEHPNRSPNRSTPEERPLSEPREDASVTEKAPHSYIIVGYDGENYRPLIVGTVGHYLDFNERALMGLCGIEPSPVRVRTMEVPFKWVPADDFEKLRTLLASLPTEVQT